MLATNTYIVQIDTKKRKVTLYQRSPPPNEVVGLKAPNIVLFVGNFEIPSKCRGYRIEASKASLPRLPAITCTALHSSPVRLRYHLSLHIVSIDSEYNELLTVQKCHTTSA